MRVCCSCGSACWREVATEETELNEVDLARRGPVG